MSEARFNIIMLKYQNHGDWKKVTTEILIEIYGGLLKFMSAKGTRGTSGVYPKLYFSIYRK